MNHTIIVLACKNHTLEGDTVIIIIPRLRRNSVVALPYLELDTRCRIYRNRSLEVTPSKTGRVLLTCPSVKTEVGPGDLHLGAVTVDEPTLRLAAVTIVSI